MRARTLLRHVKLHSALYEAIDFAVSELEEFTGPVALSQDEISVLIGRMRNPSLSLHGISGGSSGPEDQTVKPATVTGKFSLRYVLKLSRNEGQTDTLVASSPHKHQRT